MIDPTSRYYLIEGDIYETGDGRRIRYKKRRFLPQGEKLPLFVEATVQAGERVDTLTVRTLGDPLQFWQICDANNTMNPFEVVATPGRKVRIPLPQFQST